MGGQSSKASVSTVDIAPIGSMDGGARHLYYVPDDLSRFTNICVAIDNGGVCSVLFSYLDKSGNEKFSPRFGGDGGLNHMFYLEDGEDITMISGTYEDDTNIMSLSMGTRARLRGPYGPTGSRSFIVPMSKGKVIGFSGSYGDYIHNLGFVIEAA